MSNNNYRPIALIILDGWGISSETKGNAVKAAKTPYIDSLFQEWSSSEIKTSGLDVGLPQGQMGNSEVGHINLGAGRIVYQDLMRINRAIDDKDFFMNPALKSVMQLARKENKKLHIAGLLSDGGVHSHINHLFALLRMAKLYEVKEVCIHPFYDGRDTPPEAGLHYTKALEASIQAHEIGKIASINGRYYAMDRDKRWDRTEAAYRALCDPNFDGAKVRSAREYIHESYDNGITDEFLRPAQVVDESGEAVGLVESGDCFIFINFRPDRARQLTRAFMDENFSEFDTVIPAGSLHFVTMTEYDDDFRSFSNLQVAFKPTSVADTLGEVFSRAQKRQLRIAETEKYAHVTLFFNGGREENYPNEDRLLIPSPKVATYDLKPEMSAAEVTAALNQLLDKDIYDLIILNYANCDMVGHTGDFDAAVKAVETVDNSLSKIVPKILQMGGLALITADHGNAETMLDVKGGKYTAHTTNPVPLILVGTKDYILSDGRLADIAPTILELASLPQPALMTGQSLLKKKESSNNVIINKDQKPRK